jgi:isoquinoline 1-oxidoreductase subunit alpha
MATRLNINGEDHDTDLDPAMPLLWYLREQLKLTGTKFGCGVGSCGACTVHVDGNATRSCILTIAEAAARNIKTIEALTISDNKMRVLQEAWITYQVPQCGYCQSGQLMAAASLLASNANPSDADIDAAMTNICRCGTYPRIRSAIHAAASKG